MDWQPIETAPPIQRVLLFSPTLGVVGAIRGLALGEPEWLADDWNGDCCGCQEEIIADATHWMPLPDPPDALRLKTVKPLEEG